MHRISMLICFFALCSVFATTAHAAPAGLDVPSVAVTRTGQPLVLSSQLFNAIQLTGDHAESIDVKLTADNGTLSVATQKDVLFMNGLGIDTKEIQFTASPEATNTALDGMTFKPDPKFAGKATITVSVVGTTLNKSVHVSVNQKLDAQAARDQILQGVTKIHGGGNPGYMAAYGPEAYDIAIYKGDPSEGAIIAAASWGKGRVIAVPDHQMLDMSQYGAQSGVFYNNAIAWLAGTQTKDIKIVGYGNKNFGWLGANGYTNLVDFNQVDQKEALKGADVFIAGWLGSNPPQAHLDAIADFVQNGGALFIADYGVGYTWWWSTPLYQAPGNRLLREAGIGFTSGNHWDSDLIDANFKATGQCNAETVLAMLKDPGNATESDLLKAGNLLGRVYDALNPNDPLVKQLDEGFWDKVVQISPTPKSKVSNAWDKALLLRETTLLEAMPLEKLTKHRTADAVFGKVPKKAPRITKTVNINPSVTRWQSTGLYAAPGEVVTLTVSENVKTYNFKIRLSGHTDDISQKDQWMRMPRVSRSFSINETTIEIASPYGGALYFDVGKKKLDLAPFKVTFGNVVEAPLFVLNQTTDKQWIEGIRDLPAPYAEFVSSGVAISLPSSEIRNLEDPTAVMDLWNKVVIAQDEVGQHTQMRTGPERINIDVQISLGYLHSGYPTQGPRVAGPELVNSQKLKNSGSWGWFHELGHEAQRRPDKSWPYNNYYTFDDGVEATVNIFTVYANQAVGAQAEGGWSWTNAASTVMKRTKECTDNGLSFAEVGVGIKLAMYIQLSFHFGWDAIKKVMKEYNTESEAKLPKTEDQKRDQWLIRMSKATGTNLGPYLRDYWKLKISDEAAAQVANLPKWLPAVGGIEGTFDLALGQSMTFDLKKEALSLDGVAKIENVTPPKLGTLKAAGNGKWTYTAPAGQAVTETFDYTVVSSTGHKMVSKITIDASENGVLMERWFGIKGTKVTDLTGHTKYPQNPSDSTVIATFDAPKDAFDKYGIRMRGFITPPKSGDYTFWIASDDGGSLRLSTNKDPAKAAEIASVKGYTNYQSWTNQKSQQSTPVKLTKGKYYYIEALMKDGTGGDHLSVAWALDSGKPALIPKANLLYYDENNIPPDPADQTGPQLTISTPKNNAKLGCVDVVFEGKLTDDGSGPGNLYVQVNDTKDTGWTPIELAGNEGDTERAWKWTLAAPGHGQHVIYMKANDLLDNPMAQTAQHKISLDCAGPDNFGLLTQEPVNAEGTVCNDGNVTVTWQATVDTLSGLPALPYEIWLDGAPLKPRTDKTSHTFKDLPDGKYTWSIHAYDSLGNETVSSKSGKVGSFEVDCTPPLMAKLFGGRLFATHVPDNALNTEISVTTGESISIQAKGELCYGACETIYDATAVCTDPKGIQGDGAFYDTLPFGGLLATVGASGKPLNVGQSESNVATADGKLLLSVNSTKSAICPWRWHQVTAHAGEGFGPLFPVNSHQSANKMPEISWTTPKDAVTTVLVVDDVEVGTYTNEEPIYQVPEASPLADGKHTWYLVATDATGNVAKSPKWTFEIDTTAPTQFEIQKPDADTLVKTPAEICWSASTDDGTGIAVHEIWSDDQVVFTQSSSETCAQVPLQDGTQCITIKAIDYAGNATATEKRCFTVDVTAPVAPKAMVPTNGACVNGNKASLNWETCQDDAGGIATVELWIDGKLQDIKLSPSDTSTTVQLTEGEHSWKIRCIDKAGLVSDSEEAIIQSDTSAPVFKQMTVSPTAGIAIEVDDPGPCNLSGVKVALNGAQLKFAKQEDVGWKYALPELAEGLHSAAVVAADSVGNKTELNLKFGVGNCWMSADCDLESGDCGEQLPEDTKCDATDCTQSTCDAETAVCKSESVPNCCNANEQCLNGQQCTDFKCVDIPTVETKDPKDNTDDGKDTTTPTTNDISAGDSSDGGCSSVRSPRQSPRNVTLLLLAFALSILLLRNRRKGLTL